MLKETQLPASRVPVTEGDATPTRAWFRFFSSLYNFVGLGSGVVPETSGGTGNVAYAAGDLLYAPTANTLARLAAPSVATPSYLGTQTTNIPQWIPSSGGVGSFTNLTYTGTLTGGTGIAAIGSTQIYKDAAGLVGFGTATPATTVHISGNTTATAQLRIDNTGTGTTASPRIGFTRTSTSSRNSLSLAGQISFTDTDTASGTFGSTIYAAGGNVSGSQRQSLVLDGYTNIQLNVGGTLGSTPRVYVTTDGLKVGNTNISSTITSTLQVLGSFAAQVPTTVNAAAYTLLVTDFSLRITTTNCTLTLPAASAYPGRILNLSTITANSVTSASSDVVPLGSSTAGTAILAATAGKFVMLQSDNTNWIVLMAN